MKVKKSTNTNMKFLYGSVFFFAIVVAIIMLFTYYAFSEAMKTRKGPLPVYQFTMGHGFGGHGCRVLFEDSLIFDSERVVPDSLIMVQRYVTEGSNGGDECFTEGSRLVVEVPGVDTLTTNIGSGYYYSIDVADGQVLLESRDK
jgi:hypothetical protein